MRSKCLKLAILALLLAGLGIQRANAGMIIRKFYDNISGGAVADLLNATATNSAGKVYNIYPNGPNKDGSAIRYEMLTSLFEGNSNLADNFGSVMEGFLEIPTTGAYTFYVAADDASELWLSTDVTPANATKIAYNTSWMGSRSWVSASPQQSSTLNLTKGQVCYVKVLYKEGSGGDNIAVGWKTPTSPSSIAVVPAQYLQPYPLAGFLNPSFFTDVADQTVTENNYVTFQATLNAVPKNYQWFKQGPATAIAGEVLSSLNWRVKLSETGTKYQLQAGTAAGVIFSRAATLTVLPDTAAPTISSVSASVRDPFKMQVNFSEEISLQTLTDIANYSIDNGVMVYGAAAVDSSNKSVTLFTSALLPTVNYTITVNGIKDIAKTPNAIAANSTKSFVFYDPLKIRFYSNVSGGGTNDILNNAAFKAGTPDHELYFENKLEFVNSSSALDWDAYIGQIRAVIIPDTTGDYNFYIASDDASILYLSTDATPDNKKAIAVLDAATGAKNFGISTTKPAAKSAAITLQAGQTYYIEGVWKEGSGGDNFSVGWSPSTSGVPTDSISMKYLRPFNEVSGALVAAAAPADVTATENTPATIAVPFVDAFKGTPKSGNVNYNYQWFKNGVAIAGATYPVYTMPFVNAADDGAVFNVVAQNNFSMAASPSAVLHVTPVTTAPSVSTMALVKGTVTVVFDRPMDPVAITNLSNYTLTDSTGSNVFFTLGSVVSKAKTTVNLAVTNLADMGVYTLTVASIKDTLKSANASPATTNVLTAFNAVLSNINNSQTASVTGDRVSVSAGGSDIWGTDDSFAFLNFPVTGNFDYRLRMDNLVNTNSWVKAGLMARVTTAQNSRYVAVLATPPTIMFPTSVADWSKYPLNDADWMHTAQTYSGNNAVTAQYRDGTAGSSANPSGTTTKTVTFPNQWLRLQRAGSLFIMYAGNDGTTWSQIASYDTASSTNGGYASKIQVGLAVTGHNTGGLTTSTISSFDSVPTAPITIGTQPVLADAIEYRGATFTVTPTVGGPFSYQWQKFDGTNWNDISGAIYSTYTEPYVSFADTNKTLWRAKVFNSTTSLISSAVGVTVQKDTVAPRLIGASAIFGTKQVVLQFDEWMDPATVAVASAYSATGFRGTVSGTPEYRASNNIVIINYTLGITTNFTIKVANVKDKAGNVSTLTNEVDVVPMRTKNIGPVDIYTATMTDPIDAGESLSYNESAFQITAGGSDIAGTSDAFRYIYQEVSGNFDVRVRVSNLKNIEWGAKAGIDVRSSTNTDAANISVLVTPALGVNSFLYNVRSTNAATTTTYASSVSPVPYPNAWVRLIRYGNTFYGLRSLNGTEWVVGGTFVSTNWPNTMLVGLAATAHNTGLTPGKTTVADFTDYDLNDLTFGPKVVSALADPTGSKATITFSENINATSINKTNFVINGGLTVNSAVVGMTPNTVVLTTSAQTPGTVYTITLNNLVGVSSLLIKPTSYSSFTAWTASPGFLYREVWNGITSLTDLKASAKYPSLPDTAQFITTFEAPVNAAANASQKISGWIVPTNSGNYTFYIAASKTAELWLSTGPSSANKVLIAKVAAGTDSRVWNKEAGQKSAAIALVAGTSYYVEAIASAGADGNNLSVIWTPDGSLPANGSIPITQDFIASNGNPDTALVTITLMPKDTTADHTQIATFTADAQGFTTPFFQWQELRVGAAAWVNMDGATGKTNAFQCSTNQNNALYRVIVSVPGATAISTNATLKVNYESTAPKLVSASSKLGSTTVTLSFDKALDPTTANNNVNYFLLNSVSVISKAELQADKKTVLLTINQSLLPGASVWAYKLKDVFGNPPSTSADAIKEVQIITGTDLPIQQTVASLINIQRAGDSIVISWNANLVAGYELQSKSGNGAWTAVNAEVVVAGDTASVTVKADGSVTFYRLAAKVQ